MVRKLGRKTLIPFIAFTGLFAGASAALAQASSIGPKPEDPKAGMAPAGMQPSTENRRAIGPKPEDPRARAAKGAAVRAGDGQTSIGPKPEDPKGMMK